MVSLLALCGSLVNIMLIYIGDEWRGAQNGYFIWVPQTHKQTHVDNLEKAKMEPVENPTQMLTVF